MDPGLGLIVNSIVPTEVEVPKLSPKSSLQLPACFLEKPHVRHALKYMDDEQREKALKVALAWKKRFAAEKWKPVVAAIEAASKEDHVRSSPHNALVHNLQTAVHPTERPRALITASVPTVPQATMQSTPARTFRWDVIPSGPVMPLSPMPMNNAFSEDALWKKSTSQAETPLEASTPATAVERQPGSLIVPLDPEARTLYDTVKNEVDTLAHKYCLARHNMRSSGENGWVLPSMIKPRDVLQATQIALHGRRLKLKTAIVKDLPDRLRTCALEEAVLRRPLRIQDTMELSEQNDWMNNDDLMPVPEISDKYDYIPPAIEQAVSILDEQREALRMFRTERKSAELELPEKALEAAWAVRIMEDAEHLVASKADESSSGDDDDGYSYGNFLRSIKSEMSTSTSSGALVPMVDELSHSDLTSLRSRANTHQTVNSIRSREFRFPQQSSTNPIEEDRLPLRLIRASSSDNSHRHSNSIHRRTDLRISTESIDEAPNGELSPEDREFRHRGPNFADLNNWAEELRNMEAMCADRHRSPTFRHRRSNHSGSLSIPTHQRSPSKRMSIDDINTRVSPTRQLHSRFSSSSSISSCLQHSPAPSLSHFKGDSRPIMLDHEYHQRKVSKTSDNTHQRNASKASIHDSSRRRQHLLSTSSVQFSVKGSTKQAEDEWMGELKRMESRERIRQGHERRRTYQLWEGYG